MNRPRYRGLFVALVLAALPACRVSNIEFWGPATLPEDALKVERIPDVPYDDEPEPGSYRRHLDLFLPKGLKDFPVVFLVHGGAWTMGDNRCCGLYASIGAYLASRGIGAVLANYQLSPGVKHPQHIKDVARAFAWTHARIADYGGRADQIFVAGHSAGGHLAALLATDDTWLQRHGLSSADIKGVMAVSGVYHIPRQTPQFTLGGRSPLALHWDQLFPLRSPSEPDGKADILPGLPALLDVYSPAFGDDPGTRDDASPMNHVRPGLPPFLLINAERDLPTLAEMADEFHTALLAQGCDSTQLKIPMRNHNSVMFNAIEAADPVGRAMLTFIWFHVHDSGKEDTPGAVK